MLESTSGINAPLLSEDALLTPGSSDDELMPMVDKASSSSSPVKTEIKAMLQIGTPVALSIMFRIAMNVTDLAMLGRLDTESLEAAALAVVWINICAGPLDRGICAAVNTLSSQAFGAKNNGLVGLWLQQGIVNATLGCIPIAILFMFTEQVLGVAGIDAQSAAQAGVFSKWITLGLWPLVMYECLQKYLQAQKIVMPALYINGVFVAVNFGLNLLLIYGVGEWEGLGFIGAPIATSLSRWTLLICFSVYVFVIKKLHLPTWEGWNLKEALSKPRRKEFWGLAIPLMISTALEEWQLQLIAVFAARLGTTQVATHNVMLQVMFFLSSIMFGLNAATGVRVGQTLGAGDPDGTKRVAKIALCTAFVIATVTGGSIALSRNQIGKIFSNDEEVWGSISDLGILVGGAYALLSFFYVSMAILDGQGRPAVVAASFFIGAWVVCVPLAYVFAFELDLGLIGLWYALCIGYGMVTCMVGTACLRSDWAGLASQALARSEAAKGLLEGVDASEVIIVGDDDDDNDSLDQSFVVDSTDEDSKLVFGTDMGIN